MQPSARVASMQLSSETDVNGLECATGNHVASMQRGTRNDRNRLKITTFSVCARPSLHLKQGSIRSRCIDATQGEFTEWARFLQGIASMQRRAIGKIEDDLKRPGPGRIAPIGRFQQPWLLGQAPAIRHCVPTSISSNHRQHKREFTHG